MLIDCMGTEFTELVPHDSDADAHWYPGILEQTALEAEQIP